MFRNRPLPLGLMVALALTIALAAQNGAQKAPPVVPPPSQPWPDDATIAHRKHVAETQPLFASDDLLSFTLAADFRAVQGDREETNRTYPATIILTRPGGGETSVPVHIRTRGHQRRNPINCTFAPLRIEFDSDPVGTIFQGQKHLKLGTHCRDSGEYPQYVVREYPVYRMFNLLTPWSFRARLAEVRYVDPKHKTDRTRLGIFLEDDDDVARRMSGRINPETGLTFKTTETSATTMMTIFEYMIANTDMSIHSQHNVVVVQNRDGTNFPVPYDFDYSGLVNAPYAASIPELHLSSVRDRIYRGPCLTAGVFEVFLARFRRAKEQLLGIYDSTPQLNPGYVREAKSYLEGFFRTIDNPGRVKKEFIDDCGGRPYM